MFFRTKTSGPRSYLQIVENRWEDGRPRQRVLATLGRLDQLQQDGQLDALLASGARLAQSVLLLSAHAQGQLPSVTTRGIGPALIFERLWQQTGCRHAIERLLGGRRFECDVERAIFLTVLHRLFDPGSDRAADKWRSDYQMVVGAVLDGQGRPLCCELWPGNTTDVKTLVPIVDRLRSRFGIGRVCIVADRGMISR